MFGTLRWSKKDDKVVYIAEKKQPKTAPFYQQKAKTDTKEDQCEERVVRLLFLFFLKSTPFDIFLINSHYRVNSIYTKMTGVNKCPQKLIL